jgi:hypothetical protein
MLPEPAAARESECGPELGVVRFAVDVVDGRARIRRCHASLRELLFDGAAGRATAALPVRRRRGVARVVEQAGSSVAGEQRFDELARFGFPEAGAATMRAEHAPHAGHGGVEPIQMPKRDLFERGGVGGLLWDGPALFHLSTSG